MSKYCQQNFDGNDFHNKQSCNAAPEPHLDRIHQDIYGGRAQKSEFTGLNLGFLRIGTSGNSFDFGVELGVARAEVKLGQESGVNVGAGIEGVASAGAGVGVGFNDTGIHGGVGTGSDLVGAAGHHGHVGVDVGTATGVNGDAGAYVGPAHAGVRGSAGVGRDGLNVGAGGGAGVDGVIGAHGGGQASLSGDSSVSVGAGGNVGPYEAGTRGGIYTDGNQDVRPGVDGYAHNRDAQQGVIIPAYGRPREADNAPIQLAPRADSANSIEVTPLPAPKQSFDTVARESRRDVLDHSVIVAKRGETYLDILVKANPGRDRESLEAEVPFIKEINHNRPIKAGAHVATLSQAEIEWKTKVLVSQRMGWAPPQG